MRTDEATNAWIRSQVSEMARQMGLDELPLRHSNFDFYGWSVHHAYGLGFKGQDLYHVVHTIIQRLFFPLSGNQGVIYHFTDQNYKKFFDDYYMMAFHQKILRDWGQMIKYHKSHGTFQSGDPEIRGEEAELGIEESPEEYVAFKDEMGKFNQVMQRVPKLLADQKRGDRLIAVWDLMKEGLNLREIAEELNDRGVPTVKGEAWTTGVVSTAQASIKESIKRLLDDMGVDWRFLRNYPMNRGGLVWRTKIREKTEKRPRKPSGMGV
jgi:hypothetical protein